MAINSYTSLLRNSGRVTQTTQDLRDEVLTNTHSPNHWRTLTARNGKPWYAAFAVKLGDKLDLEPAERVRIW
jgi:predicted metalloendopeptidase